MSKINIAVIFGGQSGEHEVSLRSARQAMDALNKEKYNIIPIAITKKGQWLVGEKGAQYMANNLLNAGREGGIIAEEPLDSAMVETGEKRLTAFIEGDTGGIGIGLVLPICHGSYVEDGKLQGMLEMLGLPYVFSGTLASALAMNKQKTKAIAKSVGVKSAKETIITRDKKYNLDKIIAKLNFPIVIKPIESGSSVGINIAGTKEELETGIRKALEYGDEVMLEQFVKGRELTVAIMGNRSPKALPVTEIIPKISGFYDYAAKYQDGGSEHVCPAQLPDDVRKKVQRYAVKVFKAVGCRDLARADFILSEDGKIFFLEINTIPGMTATSLAPESAKAAGMEFSQFLDKLIEGALERNKK